jgi:transposase
MSLNTRDCQWERIKNLLAGKPGDVGVTAHDNRRFVEAVLYRYRTGIPWRDPPERFGDWKNTHKRFSRWAQKGVWRRLFEHLAAEPDNEYAMIDSTIVCAHQHSAGAPKKDDDQPSPTGSSYPSEWSKWGMNSCSPPQG